MNVSLERKANCIASVQDWKIRPWMHVFVMQTMLNSVITFSISRERGYLDNTAKALPAEKYLPRRGKATTQNLRFCACNLPCDTWSRWRRELFSMTTRRLQVYWDSWSESKHKAGKSVPGIYVIRMCRMSKIWRLLFFMEYTGTRFSETNIQSHFSIHQFLCSPFKI
jgi:hypothetical protein